MVLVSRIFVTLIWYAPLCLEMAEAPVHFSWLIHITVCRSICSSYSLPCIKQHHSPGDVASWVREMRWLGFDQIYFQIQIIGRAEGRQVGTCSWRWWEGQDYLFLQKPSFVCGNMGNSSLRWEPLLSLTTKAANPSRRVWWRAGVTNIPNHKTSRSLRW